MNCKDLIAVVHLAHKSDINVRVVICRKVSCHLKNWNNVKSISYTVWYLIYLDVVAVSVAAVAAFFSNNLGC